MPGIAIILLGLFIGWVAGVFRRVPNKAVVKGEIVSTEYHGLDSDADPKFKAYVEYYVDDVPYYIKSKDYSCMYHVGDTWHVAYNKEDPQQAIMRPKFGTYVIMIGLIFFGIVVAYQEFFVK